MRNATLLAIVFMTGVGTPLSALDTFAKIPGVQGSSRQDAHQGWIDVESLQLLIMPPLLENGKAVRVQCSATLAAAAGEVLLPAVQFVGRAIAGPVLIEKSDEQTRAILSRLTLHDVTITSASVSDDRPIESVSFNFGKVEFSYTPQKPDGSLDSPVTATYDCTKQEKK